MENNGVSLLRQLRAELEANGTVDMEVIDDLIEKVISNNFPNTDEHMVVANLETIARGGNMIEFRKVKEHIEVYKDGVFIVSADNLSEAHKELNALGIDY